MDPKEILGALGAVVSPALARPGPLVITARDCVLCGPKQDCRCSEIEFGSEEYFARLARAVLGADSAKRTAVTFSGAVLVCPGPGAPADRPGLLAAPDGHADAPVNRAAKCFYCERTGQELELAPSCCECHPGELLCVDEGACLEALAARVRQRHDDDPEDEPLTPNELAWALEKIRVIVRGWPLELQAKIIWLREFSGLQDGPSQANVLAALEAMDEVEAVRRS